MISTKVQYISLILYGTIQTAQTNLSKLTPQWRGGSWQIQES